jgi:hypothetical protein
MGYEQPKMPSGKSKAPSTFQADERIVRPVQLENDGKMILFKQDGSTITYSTDLDDFIEKSQNYPILYSVADSVQPLIEALTLEQLNEREKSFKGDTRLHSNDIQMVVHQEIEIRATDARKWFTGQPMAIRYDTMRELGYAEMWANTEWDNMSEQLHTGIINYYWKMKDIL